MCLALKMGLTSFRSLVVPVLVLDVLVEGAAGVGHEDAVQRGGRVGLPGDGRREVGRLAPRATGACRAAPGCAPPRGGPTPPPAHRAARRRRGSRPARAS